MFSLLLEAFLLWMKLGMALTPILHWLLILSMVAMMPFIVLMAFGIFTGRLIIYAEHIEVSWFFGKRVMPFAQIHDSVLVDRFIPRIVLKNDAGKPLFAIHLSPFSGEDQHRLIELFKR